MVLRRQPIKNSWHRRKFWMGDDLRVFRAFLALLEGVGREVDRLSLQGRLVDEVNGHCCKSAQKLLSEMMKKGQFNYKNVEPLSKILRNIVPHMVGSLEAYQKYRDGK